MPTNDLVLKTTTLATAALQLCAEAPDALRQPVQIALESLNDPRWRVLVSGLCSVGKSSFVCALWGDSQLLPTAVRDCTQTNTLTRIPSKDAAAKEIDGTIRLAYLQREKAIDFASRDLSYYHLSELLYERDVALASMVAELPPEERLLKTVELIRRLFREHPEQLVLNEPLTDDLDKVEQFLAFINSAEFKSEAVVEAPWASRQELLMGRRHPDGRTYDTGKLLSFRHVELLRESSAWNGSLMCATRTCATGGLSTSASGPGAPELIDSPWIPTYRNARRADLILEQAKETDILVIVALPQKFEFEPWVRQIFRTRPELIRRTLVVFNQVDTVDTSALFSRDGFFADYELNQELLKKDGILPSQLLFSCARLPFLEQGLQSSDGLSAERISRLKKVLQRVLFACEGRPKNEFTQKLRAACDPADAGVKTLREKLSSMALTSVKIGRVQKLLKALDALLEPAGVGSGAAAAELRSQCMALEMSARMLSKTE